MKSERIEFIYSEIKGTSIPLPKHESLSYRDINDVLCKCDDFLTKLQNYLIETVNDIDSLERQVGSKQDMYDVLLEEKIISDPDVQLMSTDTAKVRRAKYLLRKQAEEIRNFKLELSESLNLEKMLNGQKRNTEQKIQMAKKIWAMYDSHLKAFNGAERGTKAVDFYDPAVEDLAVSGTVAGTDTALDDKQGAEVDHQANRRPEAAPGELYKKADAPANSDDSEKSKVVSPAASIISEEGSEWSDIIDSL